uniref:Lipoma-preferred partner homolog isoform X1 n=1 Tax=Saccoglossus kowalevskii TaxID=10224 RepID=A0ABM0GIS8_SACKO|nr:PREDICTED: lipoma-preferred partner homolog isoform X1 [Saccoglossus kowalevskii]
MMDVRKGGTQQRLEQQLSSLNVTEPGTVTDTSYSYSYNPPQFQSQPKKFAPVTAPKPKGQKNGRITKSVHPPPPGPESYSQITASMCSQPSAITAVTQHGSQGQPPPPPPKPKKHLPYYSNQGLQTYRPAVYHNPAENEDLPPPPPPPEPAEPYHSSHSFPPPPPQDDLPPPPPPAAMTYSYSSRTDTQYSPRQTSASPPPPPPPPPAPPSFDSQPRYSPSHQSYNQPRSPPTSTYAPPPPPPPPPAQVYRPKEPQQQLYESRPQQSPYSHPPASHTPTRDVYQTKPNDMYSPPATQPTATYTPPVNTYQQQPSSKNYQPPASSYHQPTSSYASPSSHTQSSSAYSPSSKPAFQSGPGIHSIPRPTDQPLSKPDKVGTEAEVDALTNLLVQNMEGAVEPDFFGTCGKCNQKVMGEENGCSAMDQIFHIDCFTCVTCNGRLRGKPFYALEGKSYCEECYYATLEKCSVCSHPIMDRILRATGKPYHPACFTCVVCGKSLDGVPFTVDATNQIHCIEDFHKKFAPRCSVCHQPIMPEPGQEETVRIVAMDRSFHVSCYKCEDCGLLLSSEADGRGCFPLDDHILCRDCNARRIQTLTSGISAQ